MGGRDKVIGGSMIQSAEGFAEELSREAHGRGLTTKMSDLIRSRDKAIIEACVEMITDHIGMDGRIGLTESTVLLNAVLREISE
jgi:hypothetical protein